MRVLYSNPLALTFAALALFGCSTLKRGDIIDVRDFPSPDGQRICRVYGETFYDTTGYMRHIDLRWSGDKVNYPGNVYLIGPGDDVAVSWTSPSNLTVALSFETQRPVPASTNAHGVEITFTDWAKHVPHYLID